MAEYLTDEMSPYHLHHTMFGMYLLDTLASDILRYVLTGMSSNNYQRASK